MNKSFFFGLTIVVGVMYLGVFHSAKSPKIFLDPHAIVLVLGGTLAAGFIAFRGKTFNRSLNFILWGVRFRRKRVSLKTAQDIAEVRADYLLGRTSKSTDEFDPFLREGVNFLFDKSITTDAMIGVLKTRSYYFNKMYKDDAKVFSSLGKYPPAFGLLGASTGMIEMMQNLGTGGSAGIGQAMAVALVATFWGIAISNFIILPLADSAGKAVQEDAHLRDLIIEGLRLIRERANDKQFKSHLKGFLSLDDRPDFKLLEEVISDTVFAKGLHAVNTETEPEIKKLTS